GGGGSFLNRIIAAPAFTMAEILLSLTIIGVVAAITLPSLTGNINERTWATQKKALYARMSQAFPLLDSINTYDDAESFIAGALNTVTKINNVCSGNNIEDCGVPTSLTPLHPDSGATAIIDNYGASGTNQYWSYLGITGTGSNTDLGVVTNASGTAVAATALTAAFETGNGESIVLYYNPNCTTDQELAPSAGASNAENWFKYVCVNMVYDLNNNKGPNTVGKDIGFMTVFYPTDSVVVSPVPDINTSTGSTTGSGASAVSSAATCKDSEYRLPNKYEAMSMALNSRFVNGAAVTGTESTGEGADATVTMGIPEIVTSSKGATSTNTYTYSVGGKAIEASTGTLTGETRCVKR
ncbi:MAG: type II secretion system GspH family protein, partial [Fusobacterium sp.]|nr:type II secretion system GspH family protein [Fusobacterium sp.]